MVELNDELESYVVQQKRDPKVVSLLEELAEVDPLFEYHAPLALRKSWDDEKLLEHLGATYTPPKWIVDEPAFIKKLAKPGNLVVKSGDYQRLKWKIKNGDELVITNTKGRDFQVRLPQYGPLWFHFDTGKKTYHIGARKSPEVVNPSSLYVYGRKTLLGGENTWPPERINFHRVKNNLLIRYNGETQQEIDVFIPDKTQGIISYVRDNFSKRDYAITWLESVNLKFEFTRRQRPSDYVTTFTPSVFFSAKGFHLIIDNPVEYEKLFQKHIKGETREEESR